MRELPVEDELIFVTGSKPIRVKKVRYYADETFTSRLLPPPELTTELVAIAKSPM